MTILATDCQFFQFFNLFEYRSESWSECFVVLLHDGVEKVNGNFFYVDHGISISGEVYFFSTVRPTGLLVKLYMFAMYVLFAQKINHAWIL